MRIYFIFLLLAIQFKSYSQREIITDPDEGDCVIYYLDNDGDGWGSDETDCLPKGTYLGYSLKKGDCNDDDASIFPKKWYRDNDNDGFGKRYYITNCYKPSNCVDNPLDCDDTNATIYPKNWYIDNDKDGIGGIFAGTLCIAPTNGVLTSGDCNDSDPLATQTKRWYEDAENDGYGNPDSYIDACTKPQGYVENNLDLCPYDYSNSYISKGCPSFSNNNYVFTRMYKTPVTNTLLATSNENVSDQITYFDGLGRPKQKIEIGRGSTNKVTTNILNWKNTWTLGSGSAGQFSANGSTTENNRINDTNPFGQTDIIWKCGSDVDNDADGGWNTSQIQIDSKKGYQYCVWIKRKNSLDGYAHHGTSNVQNLDGTPDTNPYFWANKLPELNKWYLLVGYIHPSDYTGNDTGKSGLYDLQGNKIMNGKEFKWNSGITSAYFRNYMYYVTDLNAVQYFYAPTLQVIDGSEASLTGLLKNYDVPDLVTHYEYDNFGRESKNYLPYASNHSSFGTIYTNPTADLNNFYNTPKFGNTLNPYSEKKFEASPLDRVLEVGHAGNDWKIDVNSDADNTVKLEYLFNSSSDKVKIYNVNIDTSNNTTLIDAGYYNDNELTKSVVKNENWKPTQTNLINNTSIEFKDKLGRIVLQRDINDGKWHDTYSVYDDFGNLSYVLPPQINSYPSEQQIWPNHGMELEYINSIYSSPNSNSNYFEASLYNNQLDISFGDDGNGPVSTLNTTTPAITLNFNPPLPDMTLGPVSIKKADGTYSDSDYEAYIKNGNIYFSGNLTALAYGHVSFWASIDMSTISTAITSSISNNALNDLAYQYKYDNKNRLIEKKLPGKEVEYIVYDKLDRPILTQDGNLRRQNKWLFAKYDVFNRLVYSGIWTNPTPSQNRNTVQQLIDAQTVSVWSEVKNTTAQNIGTPATTLYYSNNLLPTANIELLAISYYDNYNFDTVGLTPEISFGITPTANVKSLATGAKVKVLETNSWTTSITYYDDKARAIYVASNNSYLNAIDKSKMKLDFLGNILEAESTQLKGTFQAVVKDKFIYDHAGRLLSQKQQIDNQQEQLLFKNNYDELGRLVSKNVGGKTIQIGEQGLQKIDFSYDIRGWLKGMNDVTRMENDLFAIRYFHQEENNTPFNYNGGAGQKLYNSNISATMWRSDNTSSSVKSYYYNYDDLDRLKSAQFTENSLDNYKFNESIETYDRNGNILQLSRTAQNSNNPVYADYVDHLKYSYIGNQLKSVTDSYSQTPTGIRGFKDSNTTGDDYDYDINGNLIIDKNKGITSIEYNHLNLPTKIVFNNADIGTANPKVILYKYNALGVKIEKKVYQPVGSPLSNTITTTHYNGAAVYKNNDLEFFSQSEGYVAYDKNASGDKYSYVFQYKDNVGNVRLAYKDVNNDGVITGASTEIFYDGFENNSGWSSLAQQNSTYSTQITGYDSNFKLSGNNSGKIEKLTTGEKVVQYDAWIPINNTAPTEYIFSGWVYSNASSADIYLFENTASETNYVTRVEYARTSEKNRWVYIEKKVTVLPDITKLNIRIDNNGGGTVWFDNVSIRRVNPTNEIVEENNFYPFGLKHEGYNNVVTGFGNALAGQFEYQGQERQEELGLMWDSFKWRNYDPQIGRFMTVDPLAEQYTYNSTYAIQENKMGLGRELEGLELSPDNEALLFDGLKTFGFGLVGAVGTGIAIGATEGLGALALGASFSLSITEMGLGANKIINALTNKNDPAVNESGSILGVNARKHNFSENDTNLIDAFGGFLPGVLNAGIGLIGLTRATSVESIIGFVDDITGMNSLDDAAKFLDQNEIGESMFNFLDSYDGWDDFTGMVDAIDGAIVEKPVSTLESAGLAEIKTSQSFSLDFHMYSLPLKNETPSHYSERQNVFKRFNREGSIKSIRIPRSDSGDSDEDGDGD